MVKCEITLPDTIATALGLARGKESIALRKELAVYFLQNGMLTFGQARQLADITRWDFIDLLRERKTPLHYDENDFEDDLSVIKELT